MHRELSASVAALALLLSSCAASGTVAFGADASAAIYAPPVCPPSRPQVALGERTIVREVLNDQIGFKPQIKERITTKEPALEAQPEPVPVQESRGAAISETGGGVIRTAFGFLGGVVKGVLGWLVL